MKKFLIFLMCLSCVSLFAKGHKHKKEEQEYEKEDQKYEDVIDPEFYNCPLIEYKGHIYRVILMEHHKTCPCNAD